jgi:proline dehydrogenase
MILCNFYLSLFALESNRIKKRYKVLCVTVCEEILVAAVRIYKRNETFVELSNLVEELSTIGLPETLKKYYKKPMEHEARSIVAGPSFIQFLNKLFRIQIAAGDILQFESANNSKHFMFSMTGTWDEIIELQ